MALTKKQAENMFKEQYAEVLQGTDKPLKLQEWAYFTDMLLKEGEITEQQYNTWDNPSFLK